jgi:hypothetical protein
MLNDLHTMKKSATIALLLATISSAFAVILGPFTSWDDLTRKSPDIIIARCTATPEPAFIADGLIWSDIEVTSVLKGDTKPGKARMVSQYWPHQGERFLMFSIYQSNGHYQAYNAPETYRIVPLDRYFTTNGLSGKTLNEQIQFMLQHRLEALNRELQDGADEKKRLEEGVKK